MERFSEINQMGATVIIRTFGPRVHTPPIHEAPKVIMSKIGALVTLKCISSSRMEIGGQAFPSL